ncbi:MAG: DNA photolyase family protein [Sneathiellales bacterium]|nr:DNA photolyase family protein [Sneathiellales bacterium]
MTTEISIVWFRRDLRIDDNPALTAGCKNGTVLPIYIFDEQDAAPWAAGEAQHYWILKALENLNKGLNGTLNLYQGRAEQVFSDLLQRFNIKAIYWNRAYEPWRMHRDTKLKEDLHNKGIEIKSFNGSLLWEPWTVLKSDGTPYRVFTPFYRKGCLNASLPRKPMSAPAQINGARDEKSEIDQLLHEKLAMKPDWAEKLLDKWEKNGFELLEDFLSAKLSLYAKGRDYPELQATSRLSPYLATGQISPHQIWHAVQAMEPDEQTDKFCAELGWREFSYSLLYHFQNLPTRNFQSKFDPFPWKENEPLLKRWKQGKTGIPLVDAGMRELWHTGYMHNRVRMVVASFLVKNLMINWREGAKWFWDTLLDADLANNSAGWQWVAGSGADAAPYFRIFNPISQSRKFDSSGVYIRRYVPEIAALPDKYLHAPWEAPDSILKEAAISLGEDYPVPIVDLKESREAALDAFRALS